MPCTNGACGWSAELAQRPDRPIAQVLGVAEEEVELMPEHQGQQVAGPADQQLVEPAGGCRPVASLPGADRRCVGLFTGVAVGGGERLVGIAGGGEVGRVGAHQVQVRDQGVCHRCWCVLPGELGREVDRLGVVADQPIDRPVVALDAVGVARHRVAVGVGRAADGSAGCERE